MNRPLLLVFVSALALSACNTRTDENQAAAVQGTQSGIDLAGIDKTVKPGDDFDAYANGSWTKTAAIPADRSSIGTGYLVNQVAEKRLAELIDGIVKSNPKAGSDERRIVDIRPAFLDQAAIDRNTPGALKADIDRFMAIADKKALAAAIGSTVRA